ncbi:MAG TPA: hypothetical protein VF767_09075 [Bryobacteraceae bacterium]
MSRALTAGLVIGDPEFREAVAAALRRLKVQIVFAVADAAAEPHKVERTSPDVLILDFGRPGAHGVMLELKNLQTPPAVIGAHEKGDPDVILWALRAGAREFIYPPVGEQVLANALDAIARERMLDERRRKCGKAIGFMSASGGCGATVLACHVAAELRRLLDGEVLAADFDVAGGLAAFWLRATGPYSVLDAAGNLGRLDPSYWKAVVSTVEPRLDVLSAPAEIPLSELPEARRFTEVLRFGRGGYDWVVADLGIGMGPLAAALLPELESVYLVATPDVTSLYHTRRVLRSMAELEVKREAIHIVIGRARKNQVALDPQEIGRALTYPVEMVLPEDHAEMAEAHAAGRLITPRSELGKRMRLLAAGIAGKPPDAPRGLKFPYLRFRTQEA